MGLKAYLQAVFCATGLFSALGAHAQDGGPPGSEDLGYGQDEEEVETIIVIGNKYRCPDGEPVYVDDMFRRNVCEVLLDDDYIGELESGGYYPAHHLETADELHVQARTNAEYFSNLGVRGPDDPDYVGATDGTVSCSLEL